MNPGLKYWFPALWFLTMICNGSHSQIVSNTLNLTDSGRTIENTITFSIPDVYYEIIHATPGEKVVLNTLGLTINLDSLDPEEISTRGQSTLSFRRKSFSFSLASEATFRHGEKQKSLKKFNLLSLSMDKDYCCNRLAFGMMEAARLFDLFYTFCDLRINGKSEGIYMVIERPEDWALKKKDSPLVIRRGYDNKMDKIRTGKKTTREEVKRYTGYFSQIYRSVNRYEGEEFYGVLSEWIDAEDYMKWLAFNFFVRNGDYTDEVYFYIDPGTDKFSIIPWDYDDLFSAFPHGGYVDSRKLLVDKLFFSTEDRLDEKIVSDPYLYNKYLIQFRELMNQLSPDVLKSTLEETYAELYPYYSDCEIINQSQYDLHKNVSLTQLQTDLINLYEQLLFYRNFYLQCMESKIQ